MSSRVRLISSTHKALPVLAFAAAFAPSFASAQQATAALPTREDLEPFDAAPLPPRARLEVDGDVERAPCALADPAYADISLTLTEAVFNNLGPVPPSDLAPIYRGYLGKAQPVRIVCDIRDAAATLLRARGYIAAVQVPVQRIEGGKVQFEVLYARVTAVRVLGSGAGSERLIEKTLAPLANGQPFNRFDAERSLLLARDIPGNDVRLSLKPAGTGAGDMIGEVSLRRTAVQADFNLQNYAARASGRIGGQLRAQFNGLTGMGDRTQLSFYSTADFDEQKIYQIGHDFLLGASGLRIGGRFTYADSRPDLGAAQPDVRAKTRYANFEMSYPLRRRLSSSLRAAAGFDLINQNVRFAGLPLSRDRLRVAYIRLDGEATDLKGVGPGGTIGWRLGGAIEARRGLDVFNASPNCFPANVVCNAAGFAPPALTDGNPQATVFRINAFIEGRIARKLLITMEPRAQIGSSRLFAFEQFSTGNYTIGRGFDPGSVVGDDGFGFRSELRHEGFRLSPQSTLALQPYGFADAAWVWDKGRAGANPLKLGSLGGGVRVSFRNLMRLDMTVAAPVRTLPGETKRRDPRFLLSLTSNFLPWSTR